MKSFIESIKHIGLTKLQFEAVTELYKACFESNMGNSRDSSIAVSNAVNNIKTKLMDCMNDDSCSVDSNDLFDLMNKALTVEGEKLYKQYGEQAVKQLNTAMNRTPFKDYGPIRSSQFIYPGLSQYLNNNEVNVSGMNK